jgi:hypothetical protein
MDKGESPSGSNPAPPARKRGPTGLWPMIVAVFV